MKAYSCFMHLLAVLVSLVVMHSMADDTWDGGAAPDNAWSTGANWVDNSAPSTSAGGKITFNNTALGATNVVDENYTIGSLVYENTTAGSAHTTVVATATTLLINGSSLSVGDRKSDVLAVINGDGTVQVGDAGLPTDIYVGVSLYETCTGNSLTLSSSLNASNLNNFYVGRSTVNGGGIAATGAADLSGSTISSGTTLNKLRATGGLSIGGGSGSYPIGTLKLPASLTAIEVGSFDLGVGIHNLSGKGTLDLGAGSQLTHFSVVGAFYLGKNGVATLTNWPTNVVVSVGTSGSPAPMEVGVTTYTASQGALVLTNGSFTAYLSSLVIGSSTDMNNGSGNGLVDLSSATVQIGNEPNKVKVPTLRIGVGAGRGPVGTLKLPPTVTAITVGTFDMADGFGYIERGYGTLDLGVNSQLTSFTASNAFYLANGGQATIVGWPTGVVVSIGTASAPAPMIIGRSRYGIGSDGTLALTNGSFSAYLTDLKVGINTRGDGNGNAIGILDLRQTTLAALSVTGDVSIGHVPSTISYYSHGYVYLPQGNATIGGNLLIGDTSSSGSGLLVLSNTQVAVAGDVFMDAYGTLTSYVNGFASGLDMGSTNLTITTAGAMHLVFQADPVSRNKAYWGLRMKGDATAQLAALTASPAKLTYDISGLSPKNQAAFGIHYDADTDQSFIGLPGIPSGTLIMLR